MHRAIAAMRIYACYFTFSSLQSFSLGGNDFKSSREHFLSFEAKAVCIAASVLMD